MGSAAAVCTEVVDACTDDGSLRDQVRAQICAEGAYDETGKGQRADLPRLGRKGGSLGGSPCGNIAQDGSEPTLFEDLPSSPLAAQVHQPRSVQIGSSCLSRSDLAANGERFPVTGGAPQSGVGAAQMLCVTDLHEEKKPNNGPPLQSAPPPMAQQQQQPAAVVSLPRAPGSGLSTHHAPQLPGLPVGTSPPARVTEVVAPKQEIGQHGLVDRPSGEGALPTGSVHGILAEAAVATQQQRASSSAPASSPGAAKNEQPAALHKKGAVSGSDILTLNIGGEKMVQRRRSTMCAARGSFLAARFSGYSNQESSWRYRGDDGFVLAVRASPDLQAPKTGNTLAPGDIFQVAEQSRGPDGLLYLKLSDGRGWVFERKPGVGVMCERVEAQEMDREGRHFINYSPAIFMPLLDYLGMKEMQAAGQHSAVPRGPPGLQSEFDAMLRDFGILPSPGLGDRRQLDAVGIAYTDVPWWSYGIAYEVRAKDHPVLLTALETSAVARDASGTVACTLHICEGPLQYRLSNRNAWIEAGRGLLSHREASRVEFAYSVLVREHASQCIYVATDDVGSGRGVAFGAPMPVGVSAENEDLQLITGHFSTRFDDFSDGGFYPFNGKLEYTVLP